MEQRAQRTRRIVSVLIACTTVAGSLALGAAQPVYAVTPDIINQPPVAPVTVTAFPSRDFVSGDGFAADSLVDVEIWRGGVLAGFVNDVAPTDVPATAGFDGVVEVNHPGAACWTDATPNLQAGDDVRFVEKLATPVVLPGPDGLLGTADDVVQRFIAQQTTVADIGITDAPGLVNAVRTLDLDNDGVVDTVQVRGSLSRDVDIDDLAHEFVASSGDPFDRSGTRIITADTTNAAAGVLALDPTDTERTTWVATYTGLSAHDVTHVQQVASNSIVWAPAASPTQATIVEFGEIDGPQSPCQAPKAGPNASSDTAEAIFPSTAVGATPGDAPTTTINVTNVGVGALADLAVTSAQASGDFAVVGETCTAGAIAPTAGCAVTVRFTPTAGGRRDGTLVIASDSIGGAVSIALTGAGHDPVAAPAPLLHVRPTSIDFGTYQPLLSGTAKSATITNIGNGSASLDVSSITGPNAADWTFGPGGTCSSTLAPAASCSVSLVFTPGGEGARSATLHAAAAGSPTADVNLTGAGLITSTVNEPPAEGKVVGGFMSRDFVSAEGFDPAVPVVVQVVRHNVVVGTTAPFLPQPSGLVEVNHPGAACWEGTTPDLRGGDRVRVLTQTGEVHQALLVDISITAPVNPAPGVVEVHGRAADAAGNPLNIAALAVELISGSANRYEINGRRLIGAPGDGILRYDPIDPVTNPDGLNFTATFVGLSDADVVRAMEQSDPGVVHVAGPALNMETVFELAEVAGPQAPCTAPAAAPDADVVALPAALDLPSRQAPSAGAAATSVTRDITVRSTGLAPLVIDAVSIAGTNAADFTWVPTSATACQIGVPVPVGGECSLEVRFSPSAVGDRTAELQLFTNVVGTPTRVPLHAIGTVGAEPYASVTPVVRDFPERGVNQGAERDITVRNDGEAPMTVAVGAITGTQPGDFTITGTTCGTPVAVDGACSITVLFRPEAVGSRSAALTIASGGSQAPVSVMLSGLSLTDGGFNDPAVAPRSIGIFPARDFVSLSGYEPTDNVIVQVVRGGQVIGETAPAVPQDDPATGAFDGIVEVNHVGGVCWDGVTPDIRPGDVVRAYSVTALDDGSLVNVAPRDGRAVADQAPVQDIVITQPAVAVDATTVVVKGFARDVRLAGQRLGIGSLELRLVSAGAAEFAKSGRRLLRADASGTGDGIVTYDGVSDTWTATFTGLSAADVALATQTVTGNVALWLGRDPAAGVESVHFEWGESAGPQPPCNAGATAAPLAAGLGTVLPAMPGINGEGGLVDFGAVDIAAPSATRDLTIRNDGTAPMTIASVRTDQGLDRDGFVVAPGGDLCTGVTLAVGEACTIGVRFSPGVGVERGAHHGSVQVYSDGAHSPHQAVLRAEVPVAPVISGIDPLIAARSTAVGVSGTNLANVTSAAFVDGATVIPADVVNGSNTGSAVRVTVPATVVVGTSYQVRLTTFGGTATSSDTVLIAPEAPTATAITPAAGAAGTRITVTGTNFMAGATPVVTAVRVGGVAATNVTVLSSTQLQATVAAGSADGPVTVVTTSGAADGPAFDFYGLPAVTAVSANNVRPGTVVTLTGRDFTGTTRVTLNGLPATGTITFTVLSDTQLRITLPANATNGPLAITARGGTGTSRLLVVSAAPTIISFTPTSVGAGLNPLAVVTVTGRNYVNVQSVTVGGTPVAFTVLDTNQLRFTVQAGVVSGRIAIRSGFGTGTSAANLTILPRPTITGFTPVRGAAGTRVTISGTNLAGTTAVIIGGVRVTTFVSRAAGSVVITAPVGMTRGLAPIRVETPGGTAVSAASFQAL